MTPLFNLESIYVANIIGIVLIVVLIVCNLWRLQNRSSENNNLLMLMFLALISCIADPISYSMKGVPGSLARFIVYATSTWLFAANVFSGFYWVRFLCAYLNGGMARKNRIALNLTVTFGILLLIINLFTPIVFDIDENNLYTRTKFYFVFLFIDYMLVINSLFTYFKSKAKGGFLKFFPIWIYIVPIAIGGIVQSLFYGISVTSTSIVVSIAGVLASLQNEMIYRDQLTGIFNRSYMNYLLKKYAKRPKLTITGIMLDLNGFKQINDEFGHAVGDEALVTTGIILKKAIHNLGSVIRYAGDEFIVLINTQDDAAIERCIRRIQRYIDRFNDSGEKPYKLSVAIGYHKLDLKAENIDTFIGTIDSRMYENKKRFYAQNRAFDRRKR